MSNIEYLAKEINSRYGNIKRARNCFLYTARGVRLTDMYQEGGRAILGWGGGSAFTMFKNVMNRGITGSFSTDYEKQTVRAVQTLFDSCRELFYFNSYESALKTAVQFSAAGTTVYKPWNPVYRMERAGINRFCASFTMVPVNLYCCSKASCCSKST